MGYLEEAVNVEVHTGVLRVRVEVRLEMVGEVAGEVALHVAKDVALKLLELVSML